MTYEWFISAVRESTIFYITESFGVNFFTAYQIACERQPSKILVGWVDDEGRKIAVEVTNPENIPFIRRRVTIGIDGKTLNTNYLIGETEDDYAEYTAEDFERMTRKKNTVIL